MCLHQSKFSRLSFIVRKTIIPVNLRVKWDTGHFCSTWKNPLFFSFLANEGQLIFQYLFGFQYLQVALPRDSLIWCSRTGVGTSSYVIYKVVNLFIYFFMFIFFLRFLQNGQPGDENLAITLFSILVFVCLLNPLLLHRPYIKNEGIMDHTCFKIYYWILT